jgi:radial spoke head protein 9
LGDAEEFCNYQLFRSPKNKFNYNLLKRWNYDYATDMYDTLDDLVPAHFAITMDNRKSVIFIRSLHWPGMQFYHKIDSKLFGFFYIGDGEKNFDILFME